MTKQTLILGIVLVIATFAFGGMYFLNSKAYDIGDRAVVGDSPEPVEGITFSKRGNVVEKDWVYTLIYEEPGKPALSVVLDINENSLCEYGEQAIVCMAVSRYPLFEQGARVHVQGQRVENVVYVEKISRQADE